MHIEILAHTLATDSIGARAAARLAESLVTRHRVTVVAARGAAAPHPALRLPGNVEVIALAPSVGAGDRDDDDTSQLVIAGDPEFRRYNRADDGRLRKHLSASGADAVVALSSALGAVLAQCRVPHARRVARQLYARRAAPGVGARPLDGALPRAGRGRPADRRRRRRPRVPGAA